MAPPPKRARLAKGQQQPTPPESSSDTLDKHALFTQWSLARGVQITSVAPCALPGRGIGLVTTARVEKGTRILFVPEKAMFKPDFAAVRKQQSGTERVGGESPQLQLVLSLMLAVNKKDSPLGTWTATWPTRRDFETSMPLSYPEPLHPYLPPQVAAPLGRQQADYARDWEGAKALCEKQGWGEDEFRYFWCIVNSRSFHWKPPRGGRGSMVLCPFVDYMNHAPTGSGCEVRQGARGYEVIAQRDYDVEEEVFATYGAHSNDKLLVHYGFVCESTAQHASPDDEIRTDNIILPHLSDAIKSQLQDVGFLGGYALLPTPSDPSSPDEDSEGSSESRQEWEICFKTQVAVRAALLTANEWEYFVTCGEDLSADQTRAVDRWLRPHLEAYETIAREETKALDAMTRDEENTTAISLLKTRWEQISTGIANYVAQI